MNNFDNIMINRYGNEGGKMESLEIVQILKGNCFYSLKNNLFRLEHFSSNLKINQNIVKPSITTIDGIWDSSKMIRSTSLDELNKLVIPDNNDDDMFSFDEMELSFSSEDDFENVNNVKNTESNILGDNVVFKCEDEQYYLRVQEATKEKLAYYDCKLLEQNESFYFNSNENMALFKMEITNNYIKDYIMDESRGGGIYFEYHNLPHIYLPLNKSSRGCIILAKKIRNNRYDVSAFYIPYGKALYINPNVIHNDCFLIGDYHVVYGKSKNYSTAILKNFNKLVEFNFI